MTVYRVMSLVSVPALVVAVLLGFSSTAPADGGGQNGTVKIEGTVTGVNLVTGQVAIQNRAGVFIVTAVAGTKIERNGMRVRLAAIKLGDRGQAIAMPNGVAVKIESVGP